MLSILCSTLWGQAGGFSVGIFVGGLMMNGTHNYKREDVKQDKLKDWYLNTYLKKKYPLLPDAANEAASAITDEINIIKTAVDLNDLNQKAAAMTTSLIGRIISNKSYVYFKNPIFKNKNINVLSSADISATQGAYYAVFSGDIGKLGTSANNYYDDSTGAFKKARVSIDRDVQARNLELQSLQKNPAQFLAALQTTLSGTPELATFQAAVGVFNQSNKQAPDIQTLNSAGQTVFQAWVDAKMRNEFLTNIERVIREASLRQDDPLERALKAYQEDQAKDPTAEQYDPDNTGKALTAPELSKKSGEDSNWETLEGEVKTKRIGLTYGFSVGYEKEMNKNHAFVGGNAFAARNTLKVQYNLEVNKGNRPSFGELEENQGYTFGVTVIAGKHLNPVFSVFGRGTFEFTKYDFTYNLTKDSPALIDEKLRTQKLGNWVKQAAVGVGARYNFAPLWSAEVCYDFVPATKTTVRDFNKLGDDDRRRGYIYTTSQHRAFLKVVRFFNM